MRLGAALFLATLAGCATQAKDGAPPAKSPAPERTPLTELDALEHDLAVSEQRLVLQLAKRDDIVADERRNVETESGAPPPPAAPPPPPGQSAPAEEAEPAATAPADVDKKQIGRLGSRCDLACRALGSMRVAAARICEIAGTDHPRCTSARRRLAGAEQRIAGARCACASDAED